MSYLATGIGIWYDQEKWGYWAMFFFALGALFLGILKIWGVN